MSTDYPTEAPVDLKPGTLLLTQHALTGHREIPGFWKHMAIMGHGGMVIEAQPKIVPEMHIPAVGVIATPLQVFWDRYPSIRAKEYDGSVDGSMEGAATVAEAQLGKPYDALESLHRRIDDSSFNCVGLPRYAWMIQWHLDPHWHRPDHGDESRHFQTVATKGPQPQ